MSDIDVNINPVSPIKPSKEVAATSKWVKKDEASTINQSQSLEKTTAAQMQLPVLLPPYQLLKDYSQKIHVGFSNVEQNVIARQLEVWSESIRQMIEMSLKEKSSAEYVAFMNEKKSQLGGENNTLANVGRINDNVLHELISLSIILEALKEKNKAQTIVGDHLPLIILSLSLNSLMSQIGNLKIKKTGLDERAQKRSIEDLIKELVVGTRKKPEELDVGKSEIRGTTGFETEKVPSTLTFEALIPVPLINLMLNTLVFHCSLKTAAESTEKKETERQIDMKMAKNFAKEIIKMVTDSAFLKEVGGFEDKTRTQQITIILLSTALSLLYVVEAGRMLPEEFHGMLTGQTKIDKESLMGKLISMLRSQLKQVTADIKLPLLEGLYEYLEDRPNPSDLLKPVHTLRKVFSKISPPAAEGAV